MLAIYSYIYSCRGTFLLVENMYLLYPNVFLRKCLRVKEDDCLTVCSKIPLPISKPVKHSDIPKDGEVMFLLFPYKKNIILYQRV